MRGETSGPPDMIQQAVNRVEALTESTWQDLAATLDQRRTAYLAAVEAAVEGATALSTENAATYPTAVADEVLRPLLLVLRGPASAKDVLEAWQQARTRLTEALPSFPPEVTRPEPPDLYEVRSGDSWWTGFRKAGVRLLRSVVGSIRRPVAWITRRPIPDRVQVVPLRQLARYHMAVRAPRVMSRAVDLSLRGPARSTAHLERGASDWVNEVLADEGMDDRPTLEESHEKLCERLGQALALAQETQPPQLKGLDDAGKRFRRNLDEAGSFMLSMARFRDEAVARVSVLIDARWDQFYDRAANRLAMVMDLTRLHAGLATHLEAFERSVEDAAAGVAGILEEGSAALARVEPTGELDRSAVEKLRKEVSKVVGDLRSRLEDARSARRIQTAADTLAERLALVTRDVPDAYHCQDIQDDESLVSPVPARRDYRMEELAETAFDALAIEQIRAVAEPLAAHFDAAAESPEELSSILDFNLSTAADDLAMEDPDQAAAAELLRGGIESAGAVATDAAARLRKGVSEEFPPARKALDAAWGRLHSRVRVEDQRQDELLGAWNRLQAQISAWDDALRRGSGRAEERLRQVIGKARARLLGIVRRGRTAVLQPQVTDADVERTLVAVQEVDRLTRHLPMVYQRLFALSPISDPDLAVGRGGALGRVGHLRRRWERGVAPILAVTGEKGVGKTTFLNVLARKVFEDCRVVRVNLRERLTEPGAFFATVIGVAFRGEEGDGPSLGASAGDRGPDSLSRDATQTFEALQALGGGAPVVVMVEPMEHLFTRSVGGASVVGAVLPQLRQSPPNVWWILTASSYGWALLEKLDPNVPTLASRLPLQPLKRDQLEELILKRHRKSGLPLRFEVPESLSRRAQAEAKRTTSPEAEQAIYQAEFFDRLERLSLGDITLAQFYWLRSLELDRHERLLRVRARPPLSFGFLSELDLDRAFALKSFLDHASLTPIEHAEITGGPLPRSLALFESLFGLRLIRPESPDRSTQATAVAPDERYQLHPLTARPVIEYLVAQHIVH